MKIHNLLLSLVAITGITAHATHTVTILQVPLKAGDVDFIAAPFQAGATLGTSMATGNAVNVSLSKGCDGTVSEIAVYGKTVQRNLWGGHSYGSRFRIPMTASALTTLPYQFVYQTTLYKTEKNQTQIWEVGFKGSFKTDCTVTFTQSVEAPVSTYVGNGSKQDLETDCSKPILCTADMDLDLLFCSSKNLKTEAVQFKKAEGNACSTTAALRVGLCEAKADLKQQEVTCYRKYNF